MYGTRKKMSMRPKIEYHVMLNEDGKEEREKERERTCPNVRWARTLRHID